MRRFSSRTSCDTNTDRWVGTIMDLVTHEGFPTSPTGKANKEIQHPNLFSAGWSGNWKGASNLLLLKINSDFLVATWKVMAKTKFPCHSVHYFFPVFLFALVPSCHVFVWCTAVEFIFVFPIASDICVADPDWYLFCISSCLHFVWNVNNFQQWKMCYSPKIDSIIIVLPHDLIIF